jgi:hypothetical protein
MILPLIRSNHILNVDFLVHGLGQLGLHFAQQITKGKHIPMEPLNLHHQVLGVWRAVQLHGDRQSVRDVGLELSLWGGSSRTEHSMIS